MPKVSVVVITLNEALHITDALASVAWADEIVVAVASVHFEVVAALVGNDQVTLARAQVIDRQAFHLAG